MIINGKYYSESEEENKLKIARNILHRLEDSGILENNLSMEQITAIRIAEFALDELCNLKDVQPIKKGYWIWDSSPILGNPYGSYRCSECGNKMNFMEFYCCNCGAKMVEEDRK